MNEVDRATSFVKSRLKKYYGTKTIQMNWYFNNTPLEIKGISAAQSRGVSKDFKAEFGPDPGQKFVHAVAKKLWKSNIFEEKGKGLGIVSLYPQYFNDDTWKVCEGFLDEVDNWAFHDGLAAEVFGPLILLDMSRFKRLAGWTKSENLWKRRCSAVSTVPLNQGGHVHPRHAYKMCAPLMGDKEIMVQKGVSWTIRTASKLDPRGAYEILMKYRDKTSRWILRDGSEKLPEKMRKEILAK